MIILYLYMLPFCCLYLVVMNCQEERFTASVAGVQHVPDEHPMFATDDVRATLFNSTTGASTLFIHILSYFKRYTGVFRLCVLAR